MIHHAVYFGARLLGISGKDDAIDNLVRNPTAKALEHCTTVGPDLSWDDRDGTLAEPLLTFPKFGVERLTLVQFKALRKPSLREWRKNMGLTQHQAAAKFGVSEPSWRRFEAGRLPAPARLLSQLF
jgi:hypothetical protein